MVSIKQVEQRLEHFEQVCRARGVKLTHQRLEIFREIAGTEDHPDAELLFQRVRERIPTVSLDTVYRTLWLLKDLGLVATLGSNRERTRFDANLDKHHHFICAACGLTRDFQSRELDHLSLPESVYSMGDIEVTHVEVRGICRSCATKANVASRNRAEPADRDETKS